MINKLLINVKAYILAKHFYFWVLVSIGTFYFPYHMKNSGVK